MQIGTLVFGEIEIVIFLVGFFIANGLVFVGLGLKNKDKKELEKLKEENEKIVLLEYSLKNEKEQKEMLIAEDKRKANEISSLHVKFATLHKDVEISQLKSDELKDELIHVKQKLEYWQDIANRANIEEAKALEALEIQKQSNEKLKKDFEIQSKNLAIKLNEIMQENLDAKLKKFDDSSMKSLDGLLKPFKEDLRTFKNKIEENQKEDIKRFASMSQQIEHISKMGVSMSEEAQNLAKALKGNKQIQGSWGEMILDSVLECSGLRVGTHYTKQDSYKDEDGNTKRPDVVVKLPQNRTMIIDSKVSLVDYDAYIKVESEEQKALHVKAIIQAFKNHIDTLCAKDYSKYNLGTLQYVFMFVPVEGAFAVAIQEEPNLYEYALNKHIVIANPSTLLVSLRTIYLYWQSELSTTNALRMFEEAGKLHNKMAGFVEDFSKLGNQLQVLNNTYDKSKQKLSQGSGNLMKKVEDLRTLGARTTKTLKNSKLEYDDFEDEKVEFVSLEESNDDSN